MHSEITYFLWIWYQYGLKSCFHEEFEMVIAKIVVGVGIIFVCSYINLPLYALITQAQDIRNTSHRLTTHKGSPNGSNTANSRRVLIEHYF
ncbi:MLO-like protein 9 isoform X2 [Lycium ferocissimum]|uniref:MLO-like protein 9 isoform X2 n=1 Tax=Lycium ferocissimum TaxID=112874 RepID=UPI002815D7FA|nr:MLO-like protein 9 isoform X2 [Lycium ferocissimum]